MIGCYVHMRRVTELLNQRFNTLCRVLIGCYRGWRPAPTPRLLSFNTLCRVLIGCYGDRSSVPVTPCYVSIPSVGS